MSDPVPREFLKLVGWIGVERPPLLLHDLGDPGPRNREQRPDDHEASFVVSDGGHGAESQSSGSPGQLQKYGFGLVGQGVSEKDSGGALFPSDLGEEIKPGEPTGFLERAALLAGAGGDVTSRAEAVDPEGGCDSPREACLFRRIRPEQVIEVGGKKHRSAGPLAQATGRTEQMEEGRRVQPSGKPNEDGPVPGVARKPVQSGIEHIPDGPENRVPQPFRSRRGFRGEPGIRCRPSLHPFSLSHRVALEESVRSAAG